MRLKDPVLGSESIAGTASSMHPLLCVYVHVNLITGFENQDIVFKFDQLIGNPWYWKLCEIGHGVNPRIEH